MDVWDTGAVCGATCAHAQAPAVNDSPASKQRRSHAISAERFHWQSQNSAGQDTPGGRRYLESATNGWQFQLFVRPRKGEAYRACGPVALESAEGDRPMNIVWQLHTPLPARLFREFSVLRGV